MSTSDRYPTPIPGAAPVSFRARGCVLLEDEFVAEEAAARKEQKEQREREEIRRKAEEEAERNVRRQVEALRQEQQRLWGRMNEELGRTLHSLEAEIKRQLIEMSVRVAEIILSRKLPDADMLRSVLDEVLSPISDLQGVRVRVAPGGLAVLTGGAEGAGLRPGLECVEDPELAPGDMVVESRNGIFDGRLRSRLNLLAEALAQPPVDESSEP